MLVCTSNGVVVRVYRAIQYDVNQTNGIRSRIPILLMTLLLVIQGKLDFYSWKQKRKNKPVTMFNSRPCDCLFFFSSSAFDSRNVVFTESLSVELEEMKTF